MRFFLKSNGNVAKKEKRRVTAVLSGFKAMVKQLRKGR